MASTYLTRTPSSAGNRKTYTLSFWIKRSSATVAQYFFHAAAGESNPQTAIEMNTNGTISFWDSASIMVTPIASLNDISSWYHIVIAVDTTQSTASNRVKFYVNGVQQTTFSTASGKTLLYPSLDYEGAINTTVKHTIGAYNNVSGHYNGLVSDFNFIDGTAYAASTFGSTNTVSGEWKPNPSPTVSYGTNGYKLTFADTSALGDDTSGNTNDFSMSGSGTPTLDCPSNNFATWNNLNFVESKAYPVFSNGNTKMTGSADAPYPNAISTLAIPKSGKYYAEFKMQNNTAFAIGICDMDKGTEALRTANTQIYNTSFNGAVSLKNDGSVIRNGSETNSVTPTIATGDIAMIAYDADNGAFYAGRNGTWGTVGGYVGVPTSGSSKTGAIDISAQSWFTTSAHQGFLVGSPTSGGYAVIEANFGNGYFGTTAVTSAGTAPSTPGTFEYAVPTGYQPLTTKGLNV